MCSLVLCLVPCNRLRWLYSSVFKSKLNFSFRVVLHLKVRFPIEVGLLWFETLLSLYDVVLDFYRASA